MRRRLPWLLLAALAPGGCLYVDGINERPEVGISQVTGPHQDGNYYIGDVIWVLAEDSEDPDGDGLTFNWSREFSTDYTDDPAPDDCDEYVPPNGYCFVARGRGEVVVSLRLEDEHGATTWWDRTFLIANRPPTAEIVIVTTPKGNGHFTVDNAIWLHGLRSDDEDPGDRDSLWYFWEEISRPPDSSTADFVFQPSDLDQQPTADLQEAVRLRLVPDVAGTYRVALRVWDGDESPDATSDAVEVTLEVDEDSPPCIRATDPDHATEKLIFDRGEPRRLEVLSVADDLDPYPGGGAGQTGFRWLVQDGPAEGFYAISGYHLPYLDLDGSDFSLGQEVWIRVVAEDRLARDLSDCPVDENLCALVTGCYQWVTWKIEFR